MEDRSLIICRCSYRKDGILFNTVNISILKIGTREFYSVLYVYLIIVNLKIELLLLRLIYFIKLRTMYKNLCFFIQNDDMAY